MSEENSQAGSPAESSSGAKDEKAEYVPKKAYEDTTKDMHKFKSKYKETEAYAKELEVRLKAIEEEKLTEQQRWEELYKKRDAEFDHLKQEVEERDKKYLDAVKRNALKNELGGKVKDAYLVHADLSGIGFADDGSIEQDSLLNVANGFRESYPELIPSEASPQVTGAAAPTNTTVNQTSLKPLSQMTHEERKALLNNPELQAEYRAKGLI